jgi:thioredoxin reductase
MSHFGTDSRSEKEVTMYDVVVVGGGIAGYSAALILGRARRRVLLVNAGPPRNAPAEHAHGFVTRDGTPPFELLEIAQGELDAYPNVEVRDWELVEAAAGPRGFTLVAADSTPIETRKLVLATGVTDVLPEIPGLRELWGRGVYHCPYCHGWEVRDTTWGMLGDAFATDRAALFRGWAGELVLLPDGPSMLGEEDRTRLRGLGVTIEERRIDRVEPEGEGGLRVRFTDRASLALGGLFALPAQVQRSSLAESLGCELIEPGPMVARYVKVDPVTGETTVPGVYAAGDMIGPAQSLILAAASGARAAYQLNHAMAFEDAERQLAPV